ncbi:MAG TPA: Ig-like domain-containing protein [Solirubrobacteraceae bacterium]|nr:Ig-like domain-containing protein [Solirubrobacteraceae bacterium]
MTPLVKRRHVLLTALVTAVLGGMAAPALATADLTVKPITWNVIGLDSNDVTAGPNDYLVGARACNTGTTDVTNAAATFNWDTGNANISILEPATQSLGTLAAGACSDVYYTAKVTRTSAAYDTTRGYHISISGDGVSTVSTPTPRELYVEHLVSQNRNGFISMSGPSTVQVGDTVTYTVTTKTATNGYEQLVTQTLFPPSMFEYLSTTSAYSAPTGATNDQLYADACGWDPVPTSATYRSCIGPTTWGGKAGGNPISTVYKLKVLAAGTASVATTIYDYSGSSYHYNSDYSTSITSITATTPPVAHNDSATTSPGTPVTISVLANDTDADGDTLTVTGSSSPAHGTVFCSSTDCRYTPASGYTGTDSFTYTISDGHGGTASATVNITVATTVPAFGVDSPLPTILVVVGLGAVLAARRRRRSC